MIKVLMHGGENSFWTPNVNKLNAHSPDISLNDLSNNKQ